MMDLRLACSADLMGQATACAPERFREVQEQYQTCFIFPEVTLCQLEFIIKAGRLVALASRSAGIHWE